MLLNNFIVLVGALLPLVLDKLLVAHKDARFKLSDLSKISFIVVAVYYSYWLAFIVFSFEINNLSSYLVFKILVSAAPVLVFLKLIPDRELIHNLKVFKKINKSSFLYLVVLLFFIYAATGTAITVQKVPEKVVYDTQNQIILDAFIKMPLISLFSILIVSLMGVISEELVFRYFAINILKGRVNKVATILLSTIIWTLMHWSPSLNIFFVGIFLGYFFYMTESLILCVILHFLDLLLTYSEIFYLYQIGKQPWLSLFRYSIFLFLFLVVVYHLSEMVLLKIKRPIYGSK